MKKNFILAFSIAIIFTACGGGGGGSDSTSSNTNSQSTNTQTSTIVTNSSNIINPTKTSTQSSEDTGFADNSSIALNMPNLNNDSSVPVDDIE